MTIFLTSLFSRQILSCSPTCSPSNSCPLLSLIVIACACAYTHIFLDIAFSVLLMLLVCLFSGLTLQHCTNNWYDFFPWEDHRSCSLLFSVVLVLSVGLRPHELLCQEHWQVVLVPPMFDSIKWCVCLHSCVCMRGEEVFF